MNQYRCETCNYYLKYAIACNKIKERLIVGADEWIEKVGCASHSNFHPYSSQAERELLPFDKNDPALKTAQAYMAKCQEKFQRENPCPKCGSHNTDIDWGTPMFCRDCGHEWLPELRQEGKDGEP